MLHLKVAIPGEEPHDFGLTQAVTTVGRSSLNDIVVSDKSLSRQHARIVRHGDDFLVEDLGSRNGTLLNGEMLSSPTALKMGDQITVGLCQLTVCRGSTTKVRIDSTHPIEIEDATVFRANATDLRARPSGSSSANLPAKQMARLIDSMRIVNELTVELLRDITVEELLRTLTDRVFDTLHPDRCVILLRQGSELLPAISRTQEGESDEEISLSQTLVSTVMERHEGLVLIDSGAQEGALAEAKSLVLSGVRSLLAAPLENNGQTVGLLYLDSRVGRHSFTEEDLRLVTLLANVATAKIQNAELAREAADKKRMERDFNLARQIQEKLLPEAPPAVPGLDLYGSNKPSKEVSGDYFDFRRGPDGKLYAVVADVCGKGVGPALLMAWLEATFSAWSEQAMPLPEMVTRLSQNLAVRTMPGRFITAFFLLADPEKGTLQYVNAGHNSGILLRGNGQVEELGAHGRPLSLFPEPYSSTTLQLAPGDLLVLYTDGITEAANPEDEEFGLTRLKEWLAAARDHPLREIDKRLSLDLENFRKSSDFADDRTLLLLRCVAQ